MPSTSRTGRTLSYGVLDALIRVGLVVVLVLFCFRVVRPLLDLLLWAVILAVTLHPLDQRVKRRLRLREGLAATVVTAAALVIVVVPIYLLVLSMVDSAHAAIAMLKSGRVHLPLPNDAVAQWPVIGDKLHRAWMRAATDLAAFAEERLPQLRELGIRVLRGLTGIGLGLLMFMAALVIAGIVMAHGEAGRASAERIASRLFGPARAAPMVTLCTRTIRAVAQGVIGIAFVQMLLIGPAFALVGVPGAGVLALGVLLLGILQLPATLITLPVIIYVFATDGATAGTIVFAVWVFVAGLVDNVLKPLLLGRGVDVPMPVVLVGALGGLVTNGIIGLFIGPVVLAVGYELFWQWVDDQPPGTLASLPTSPPQAELPI